MFVISKRYCGDYKFIFASRKGKTIITSIGCKEKSDCEWIIRAIKENKTVFAFTKYKKAADKHFFQNIKTGFGTCQYPEIFNRANVE